MPPRPSAVLAPDRSVLVDDLRALVLLAGGTVTGMLLVAVGRVVL